MYLTAIKLIAGLDWEAILRIAVILGAGVLVWKAWSHYEELLEDRLENKVLRIENQEQHAFIEMQNKSRAKQERSIKELGIDLMIAQQDSDKYKQETIKLEVENDEYKAWRDSIIDSIADKRLRERENTVRANIRKRASSSITH